MTVGACLGYLSQMNTVFFRRHSHENAQARVLSNLGERILTERISKPLPPKLLATYAVERVCGLRGVLSHAAGKSSTLDQRRSVHHIGTVLMTELNGNQFSTAHFNEVVQTINNLYEVKPVRLSEAQLSASRYLLSQLVIQWNLLQPDQEFRRFI